MLANKVVVNLMIHEDGLEGRQNTRKIAILSSGYQRADRCDGSHHDSNHCADVDRVFRSMSPKILKGDELPWKLSDMSDCFI